MLLALLIHPASARGQEAWRSPQGLAELGAQLEATLAAGEVAGAAVALVDREGLVWSQGFGVADRATGRPVDADTLFRVGSISKSFTAQAVMQLVEAGTLDLEARLATLAPEVAFDNPWEATRPVRLVHLLEHSAGFDDVPYADYRSGEPNYPVAAYAEAARPPAHWPPGEYFRYANPGPAIASYLVERASGRAFDDYIEAPSDAPTAVLVQNDESWQLLTAGGSYRQVNALWVWATRALLAATVTLTLWSLLYALAELPRLARLGGVGALLQLAPLVAGAAALAVPALVVPTCFLADDAAALDRCGTPGLWVWRCTG